MNITSCLWLLWLLDFKIARWTHLPDLFSSLNVWSCVPRNSARNLLGAFGSLKQPSKKKSVFAVDSEMKTDAQTVSTGMYSKKQAINPSIFFYFHSFIDCWTLTIWVPLFLSLFFVIVPWHTFHHIASLYVCIQQVWR